MFEGIKATILDKLRPVSPEQIWKDYYEEGLRDSMAQVEFERKTASSHTIEELEQIIRTENPDISEEELLGYLEFWKKCQSRTEQDWELEKERKKEQWNEKFEAFKSSEAGAEYLKFEQESYRYEKAMQAKFDREYSEQQSKAK